MNILSALYSVPSIYFVLILAVFLILLVEIFYIIRKKKKQPLQDDKSNLSNSVPPSAINTTNVSTGTFAVATPRKKSYLKYTVPLVSLVFVGSIVFIAASFLKNPQPGQESRGRAYKSRSGTVCDLQIDLTEDPLCPQIAQVENGQIVPNKNGRTNNVSRYNITYKLTNTVSYPRRVKYKTSSSFCMPPFGKVGENNNIYCSANTKREEATVDIGPQQSVEITTGRSSDTGTACGSYQIDFTIISVEVEGHTTCNIPTGNLSYWALCQTGISCENVSPTPTNTPTPTVTPSSTPTATPTLPGPSATPTVTPPGPSATSPPGPMCSSINFYTVDLTTNPPNLFLNSLSSNDLKNLKPGDKINITTIDTANSIQGRIRLKAGNNQFDWHNLTSKRTGTNEFYDANVNNIYTVDTSNGTTFTVEGQVQDSSGVWH